jgi:hypothetical protein
MHNHVISKEIAIANEHVLNLVQVPSRGGIYWLNIGPRGVWLGS